MKTAIEMIDERLTIQDGFHKGARIPMSAAIAELVIWLNPGVV